MKNRRRPVRQRWLTSYLVVLLVPMLLSTAIYFYSRRIIIGNAEELYAASLEQAKIEVDGQLAVLYRMLDQIAVNNYVRRLTFAGERLNPEEHFTVYKLVGDLRNYHVIYPLLDDVLVVLNRTGTAVGVNGHMSIDLLYDIYFRNDEIDSEKFRNIFLRPDQNRIYQIKDKLLFLRTAGNIMSGGTVTAALVIRRPLFEEQYLKSFAANGSILYITGFGKDSVERLIGGAPREETAAVLKDRTGEKAEQIRVNNIQYFGMERDSDMADWKFHYLIPTDLQKRQARQIQFFTLGGFLICSLFGLFFSLEMTRGNYDPVHKLITIFKQNAKKEPGRENELAWIEKQTGEFFRKYHDIQTALQNNVRILRKYYIYTLLEKPFDPAKDGEDMLRYAVHFPGEYCVVILFVLPEDFGAGQKNGEQKDLVCFVLAQTFREAAERYFSVEMTDAGQNIAAVADWSGETEKMTALLEDTIELAQRKTGEAFSVPVSAVLGNIHRGKEGIYYSNLEAKETIQYLDLSKGQNILRYNDIKCSEVFYHYPSEIEEKLINFIRLGDEEKARVLLRQVFDENTARQEFSEHMAGILAADIIGTLMKGRLTKKVPSSGSGFPVPARMPVKELPRYLEQLLAETCRANLSMLKQKGSRQLGEKIKAYIGENFKDPNLNISITALHFDLTPAYLSGIFREETGLNLLEYINGLRIEEGKKLLARGCSITCTAELTGFRGSSTFIRVFRKMTGVTPGQYKDIG